MPPGTDALMRALRLMGAKIRFAGSANSSLPPCGGGMGWGVVQYGTAVPHRTTPTPIPAPQGGAESLVGPSRLSLAPMVWRYAVGWLAAATLLPAMFAPSFAGEPELPGVAVVVTEGIATLPATLTGKPGDVKEGAKVVTGRRLGNCLSCHEIGALREEEFHGDVGPPLDGVAGRWDTAALRMIVVNPKMVFGGETVMPAFYRTGGLNRVRPEFAGKPVLTAQQVEDVVAFLATLR